MLKPVGRCIFYNNVLLQLFLLAQCGRCSALAFHIEGIEHMYKGLSRRTDLWEMKKKNKNKTKTKTGEQPESKCPVRHSLMNPCVRVSVGYKCALTFSTLWRLRNSFRDMFDLWAALSRSPILSLLTWAARSCNLFFLSFRIIWSPSSIYWYSIHPRILGIGVNRLGS